MFYIEVCNKGKKRGSIIPCTVFSDLKDAEIYAAKQKAKDEYGREYKIIER